MKLFANGKEVLNHNTLGKNYLLNTAEDIETTGQNRVGQTLAKLTPIDEINVEDDVYTFTINIYSSSSSGTLYIGNNPNWKVYKSVKLQQGMNNITFTAKLQVDFKGLVVTVDNCNASKLTVSNARLNQGSIAYDWAPAPEDFKTLKAKVDQLTKNQNGGIRQPANPIVSMFCVPSELEVA